MIRAISDVPCAKCGGPKKAGAVAICRKCYQTKTPIETPEIIRARCMALLPAMKARLHAEVKSIMLDNPPDIAA